LENHQHEQYSTTKTRTTEAVRDYLSVVIFGDVTSFFLAHHEQPVAF